MRRIQLSQLSQTLADVATEFLQLTVEDMAETAQEYAPVDSGHLAANIKIGVNGSNESEEDIDNISQTKSSNSQDSKSIRLSDTLTINSNAHYSLYVEEGTDKMQAQPYLMPVADSIQSIVNRASDKVK